MARYKTTKKIISIWDSTMYKRVCIIKALCCFLIGLYSDSIAEQKVSAEDNGKQKHFVTGINANFIRDVDIKDATAAARIWIKELAGDFNYTTEVILYKDTDLLLKDIAEGKVDFVNSSSLDYLRMKKKVDIEVIFTEIKNDSERLKYMMLANANSSIETIQDAYNKRFIIKKGSELGLLFLNTVLLRNNADEARNYFSSIKEAQKHSQAILSVFFQKNDVCMVPDRIYKNMIELNPQIGKQLRIIVSSEDVVNNVSYVRKNLDPETKEKMKSISNKVKDSQRGTQLLTLFQADGLTTIEESDLNSVKELLEEYEELKINKKIAKK